MVATIARLAPAASRAATSRPRALTVAAVPATPPTSVATIGTPSARPPGEKRQPLLVRQAAPSIASSARCHGRTSDCQPTQLRTGFREAAAIATREEALAQPRRRPLHTKRASGRAGDRRAARPRRKKSGVSDPRERRASVPTHGPDRRQRARARGGASGRRVAPAARAPAAVTPGSTTVRSRGVTAPALAQVGAHALAHREARGRSAARAAARSSRRAARNRAAAGTRPLEEVAVGTRGRAARRPARAPAGPTQPALKVCVWIDVGPEGDGELALRAAG